MLLVIMILCFPEEMAGFSVYIKNTTGDFVKIWDDSPAGTNPASEYQPRRVLGDKVYMGRIVKVEKKFPTGQTGILSVCEVDILGGKLAVHQDSVKTLTMSLSKF